MIPLVGSSDGIRTRKIQFLKLARIPIPSQSYKKLVLLVGFEPTLPCENQILSLARLPFHHRSIKLSVTLNVGFSRITDVDAVIVAHRRPAPSELQYNTLDQFVSTSLVNSINYLKAVSHCYFSIRAICSPSLILIPTFCRW